MFATRSMAQCPATITALGSNQCSGTPDTLIASAAPGNLYQWAYSPTIAGPFNNITGLTSDTIIISQAGYYVVKIVNGSCIATSAPFSVSFLPAPSPLISVVGPTTICPGQNVILSANSGTLLQYSWTNAANTVLSNGTSISIGTSGVYKVKETNQYGCSATSSTVNVTVLPAPTPVIIPSNTIVVCDSTSKLLQATAGSSATYSWSVLSGSTFVTIPGFTNASYLVTANGTFEVIAAYPNGCAATSAPASVTFSTTPAQPIISANNPVCLGSTLNLNIGNSMTGYTYQWNGPGGFSSTQQNAIDTITSPSDSGFYTVRVYNNGCFNIDSVFVGISCIDSVWPGDVNKDHIVNNNDALDLALGFGYTGTNRSAVPNISWTAQFSTDWTNYVLPGVNMKHADCDGNGAVGFSDTIAIYANYGLTHSKGIHLAQAKMTGVPDLYFDTSGYKYLYPGQSVSIPIKLGTPNIPMYNILGISADIRVTGLPFSAPIFITYPTSWLGGSANTLRFAHHASNNTINWAYARTDHNNINGNGTIAYINFVVPAVIGYNSWASLYFENVRMIDKNGNPITAFNALDDTTVVNPTAISSVGQAEHVSATIAPNPSAPGAPAYLQLNTVNQSSTQITITDITGRPIWKSEEQGQGAREILLPSTISAGIYYIHLQQTDNYLVRVLKWLKN